MPLEWLFGRKMTPEEMLRKNQRALTKAMRDLDRERGKMEQQEKKIIADIKKMAKMGQMVRLTLVVSLIADALLIMMIYNNNKICFHTEVCAYVCLKGSTFI